MATIRDFPLANYPTGTYSIGKAVNKGLKGFQLAVGRCTTATPTLWPNASTTLHIEIEGSYDGGVTFTGGVSSVDDIGGIKINDEGLEIVETIASANFNPPVNYIKILITIGNGPLRSYGDVTLAT